MIPTLSSMVSLTTPKTYRLFVTGKLWPKLFEIKIVHQPSGLRKNEPWLSVAVSLPRKQFILA